MKTIIKIHTPQTGIFVREDDLTTDMRNYMIASVESAIESERPLSISFNSSRLIIPPALLQYSVIEVIYGDKENEKEIQ